MNQNITSCLCATICSLLVFGLAGLRQDPVANEKHDEVSRLEILEQRVEAIEQIMFATSQLDAREAARRLERARYQLDGTRDLFQRGLIADAQLEQDRFAVLIAEREVELAANPTQFRQIVCGLELLDAQRRLEMAKLNLRQTTNMNSHGFASLTQIDDAKKELTTAEAAVVAAQKKVEAATRLDAINDPPNPEKTEPPNGGR